MIIFLLLLASPATELDEAARRAQADFAFERACELQTRAYRAEPTDERGFRAAHCLERVGDFPAARKIYDSLSEHGELRDIAFGSRAQIENREAAPMGIYPFELGIASPLHLFHSKRKAVWGLSLTIFYSRADVHHGLEIGAAVARVKENFRGVSIDGLAHWVEGSAGGIEISGFGNFDNRAWGLQLAGGGNVDREFYGLMVCGFWNRADVLGGLQISVLNQALTRASGVQLGMLNINNIAFVTSAPGRSASFAHDADLAEPSERNDPSTGVPGGAVASSGESQYVNGMTTGAQIGAFNYADEITGVQIGVVNVAHRLHGLQLGLFNIATKNALPFMVIANFGL